MIAIIGMLAALITAAVQRVRGQATKAKARTTIDVIGGGLEAYKSDYGIYPGFDAEPDEVNEETNQFPALYEALCGEKPPKGGGGRGAPYVPLTPEDICVEDPDDVEGGGYRKAERSELYDPDIEKFYRDPWSNPYIYRENENKPDFEEYMLHRHGYDLYSMGPDETDQTMLGGEEDSDDITN